MNNRESRGPTLRHGLFGLVAVAWLCAADNRAPAAVLVLSNETQQPIILQTGFVSRNVVFRSRPAVLMPGAVLKQTIPQPGKLIITIYDSNQPSKVLFSDAVQSVGNDLVYSVKPAPPPNRNVVPLFPLILLAPPAAAPVPVVPVMPRR